MLWFIDSQLSRLYAQKILYLISIYNIHVNIIAYLNNYFASKNVFEVDKTSLEVVSNEQKILYAYLFYIDLEFQQTTISSTQPSTLSTSLPPQSIASVSPSPPSKATVKIVPSS